VVLDDFLGVGSVLEGSGLEPVWQREFGGPSHVGLDDGRAAPERGERPGGPRGRDVPPVALDAGVATQRHDLRGELPGERHLGE